MARFETDGETQRHMPSDGSIWKKLYIYLNTIFKLSVVLIAVFCTTRLSPPHLEKAVKIFADDKYLPIFTIGDSECSFSCIPKEDAELEYGK